MINMVDFLPSFMRKILTTGRQKQLNNLMSEKSINDIRFSFILLKEGYSCNYDKFLVILLV